MRVGRPGWRSHGLARSRAAERTQKQSIEMYRTDCAKLRARNSELEATQATHDALAKGGLLKVCI